MMTWETRDWVGCLHLVALQGKRRRGGTGHRAISDEATEMQVQLATEGKEWQGDGQIQSGWLQGIPSRGVLYDHRQTACCTGMDRAGG